VHIRIHIIFYASLGVQELRNEAPPLGLTKEAPPLGPTKEAPLGPTKEAPPLGPLKEGPSISGLFVAVGRLQSTGQRDFHVWNTSAYSTSSRSIYVLNP